MCIHLSKRLTDIASFLPTGTYFADIGSDHAYLPCYVCLQDPQARAISGDVNYGPYASARKTVEKYHLQDVVDVRLGNGLEVLQDDPITELVIAGMGGSLIQTILATGKDKLHSVERMILQPNTGELNVREWLMHNGFIIQHETILKENNHIYEIIVADRVKDKQVMLSNKELYFGPHLLKNKSTVFFEKWHSRKVKLCSIVDQLKRAKDVDQEKTKRFRKELQWIKEVLENGEDE